MMISREFMMLTVGKQIELTYFRENYFARIYDVNCAENLFAYELSCVAFHVIARWSPSARSFASVKTSCRQEPVKYCAALWNFRQSEGESFRRRRKAQDIHHRLKYKRNRQGRGEEGWLSTNVSPFPRPRILGTPTHVTRGVKEPHNRTMTTTSSYHSFFNLFSSGG